MAPTVSKFSTDDVKPFKTVWHRRCESLAPSVRKFGTVGAKLFSAVAKVSTAGANLSSVALSTLGTVLNFSKRCGAVGAKAGHRRHQRLRLAPSVPRFGTAGAKVWHGRCQVWYGMLDTKPWYHLLLLKVLAPSVPKFIG